jgi:hypothetical protein
MNIVRWMELGKVGLKMVRPSIYNEYMVLDVKESTLNLSDALRLRVDLINGIMVE